MGNRKERQLKKGRRAVTRGVLLKSGAVYALLAVVMISAAWRYLQIAPRQDYRFRHDRLSRGIQLVTLDGQLQERRDHYFGAPDVNAPSNLTRYVLVDLRARWFPEWRFRPILAWGTTDVSVYDTRMNQQLPAESETEAINVAADVLSERIRVALAADRAGEGLLRQDAYLARAPYIGPFRGELEPWFLGLRFDGLLAGASVLAIPIAFFLAFRGIIRIRRGLRLFEDANWRCPRCLYDVSANHPDTCPECGQRIRWAHKENEVAS